jgi:LCP family protein required for cell wall assembly
MQNFKWKPNHLFLIISIAIVITGCSIPALSLIQKAPQTGGYPVALMVSTSGATPTPTPFQPLDPTPTYIPTAVPTLPPTSTPEYDPNSPGNNQPAGAMGLPENQINILVLGSDQRIDEGGFRTDTIILVSINTTAKKVSMVSFPRDLWVYIPGWSYERINTAMFHGGFDLMASTLEYNFGVKPKYYILVNFSAFEEIITTLGGIDVEVAQEFRDQYWNKKNKTIPAGTVHMDGAIALWYARARKSTNDFDRERRQQEVLQAVAKKILSVEALENAKDLYDIYIANVTTNLTWSEITPLIPLTVHLKDLSKIQRYVIGPGEVYDWITPGGAMVLLPRQDMIIALLKQALEAQ